MIDAKNQTTNKGMIYMHLLYNKESVICKLWKVFSKYFCKATKPTQKHLFDIVLSVLGLNGLESIKFNYDHFMNEISEYKLKSYYYTLNESKMKLCEWMKQLTETALSVMDQESQQPIVLSIDDTMIEKFGEKFDNCSKLFDHAAHNGSNYLNGHCFVSLLLSVPVCTDGRCHYLSVPVGYRMWTKETSKLAMAAELVRTVMKVIGTQRQVILCCDSWYPKGDITGLIDEFENLAIICNVRSDTVLYDLPPKPTGKRGRPRKYGNKLAFENFTFQEIPNTDFYAGSREVLTNLFGDKIVHAVVTKAKKSNSCRLFLCTQTPQSLNFDISFITSENARTYAQADAAFLPMSIYSLRWNIEVSYYEQKTFWSLGDYMLRSCNGIERLVNLITLVYSTMTLLPYLDLSFSQFNQYRPQQIRFLLGNLIHRQLFFATFVHSLKSSNFMPSFILSLEQSASSFIFAS